MILNLIALKKILNFAQSNLVHLLGFLIATYVMLLISFLSNVETYSLDEIIKDVITAPIFLLTYGLLPILGFIITITVLDIICFYRNNKYIIPLLFAQWILIVPRFILWAFEYEYWLWIYLALSFMITQYLRINEIKSILRRYNKNKV